MSKPRRMFEVHISAGADNLAELVAELHNIIELIESGHSENVSGGYAAGSRFILSEDPAMTHDEYFARLEAMLP